jgi:rhodanese-related sulfurtransferase
MLPEISVTDLGEKLRSGTPFVLLDVREHVELNRARVTDERLVVLPLSRLAHEGSAALPQSVLKQDLPVYIMCHHGNRSQQVTGWLVSQGYKNVFNVSGGIDEYARRVDPSVGSY